VINVVGLDNISFESTQWLHQGNDSTLPQASWYFFKNDIWRFPLGSNPNYGDELGSSIIFADSIPILSLIFKSVKIFLPEDFQYISFWYFICFYFQLYFSYRILKFFTNSDFYSAVGSLFFIITPIFVWKIQMVPALAGHWVLLFSLYLSLKCSPEKAKLSWYFLILLSSLINFYFMIMVFFSYFLLRIIYLNFNKKSIFSLIGDFFILGILLLFTLYFVGYFEIRIADTVAIGFGRDKLNLLGIFDSANTPSQFYWSWFMPDLKHAWGEETEGFNYFGLGQLMLVLFAILFFYTKKYQSNLQSIKTNKEIKALLIISLFFTLWALSNKISFGPYTILEIPLNKYIFGLLSIVRPTGRLFWIVNYFILLLSLIIIFRCFDNKKSLFIISLFLFVQIADTSRGVIKRINYFSPIDENRLLKDKLWGDLFKNYKILKSTYPSNYSALFTKLSYSIEKYKIEKTNLVKLARINRKAVADAKYNLYSSFRKKKLSTDTVYVVDGLGHLKNLKYIFKDTNVGFFYRDDIWVMVANEKERMNQKDNKLFNEIELSLLEINKKYNFNAKNKNNYNGFGWSHNSGKSGVWSEGKISTLLFKTDKKYKNLKLSIDFLPHITKKNAFFEFEIFVNNLFFKKIKLTNGKLEQNIEIIIKEEFMDANKMKIDFQFKNIVSPYDVLTSPDSRKLGILLKNIIISPV